MKVALGLRAHSGWAVLVVLGSNGGEPVVVDRRRIELVGEDEISWAKQPYHAAEKMKAQPARELVRRGIESARRIAVRRVREVVKSLGAAGHQIQAGAVLMSEPMPDWTVDEILAVHFRMHKAEGVLFRDALGRAVQACGLRLVAIPEKRLDDQAGRTFGGSAGTVRRRIEALGKQAGPPWGRDQKDSALAAMIALHTARHGTGAA